jgi:hypothetical protein
LIARLSMALSSSLFPASYFESSTNGNQLRSLIAEPNLSTRPSNAIEHLSSTVPQIFSRSHEHAQTKHLAFPTVL